MPSPSPRKSKPLSFAEIFLASAFVTMCVVKLWYTIFLIFAAAIVVTIVARRRSYCKTLCPIGYISDTAYEAKGERGHRTAGFKAVWKGVRVLLFVFFWGYLVYHVATYWDDPGRLWVSMLAIMLGSLFVALGVQHLVKRRFWCSHLCPLGPVLNVTMRGTKRLVGPRRRPEPADGPPSTEE